MKKGDIVILTGIVVDDCQKKGHIDIVCGRKSQGIQIFRLNKSTISCATENINDIIRLGKKLENTLSQKILK